MKPTIIIILIVLLAGTLYWFNSGTEPAPVTEVVESEPIEQSDSSFPFGVDQSGVLSDIMAIGQSVQCEYSVSGTEEGVSVAQAGVMYYSDGKIRVQVEIDADLEGESIVAGNANSIMVDDVFYNWMEGSQQGTQLDLSEIDPVSVEDTSEVNLLAENFTYNCQPWDADESVFVVPADVTFTDLSALMNQDFGALEEMQIDIEGFDLQVE